MKKVIIIALFGCFQLLGFAQWNTERILTIGRNALYFEDYVLSIQYFNQVIKIKPYWAEPYMYRAMAKAELGDDQGAELDATEAIERNPFLPQAYYVRGFVRRKLKLYSEAANDFSKAYEFSPENQNLLTNKIYTLVQNEDYSSAIKDFKLYMKLNSNDVSLLYDLGKLQLANKDTIEAEITFENYINKDSTNAKAWCARGELRMQKRNFDGALNDFNEALKRNKEYSKSYIFRGLVYYSLKKYNQALIDLNDAIKYDEKSVLGFYYRGLLKDILGDKNKALEDLKNVTKLDSTFNEALLIKADLEYELGNYNNAIIDFGKIIQKDSSNTEAVLNKANLELFLGKYREAIKDYKVIVKRHPYYITAYKSISEAELAIGNKKAAFEYLAIARNIEKNKEKIKEEIKKKQNTNNDILSKASQVKSSNKTLFLNLTEEEESPLTYKNNKYLDNSIRGTIQEKHSDVINERNFVLSYYAKTDETRRTNLYQPIVEDYNKKRLLSTNLKITNNEIPLTSELVNSHFDAINNISSQISRDEESADLYFHRALEFALVQDFSSSVEDLNKTLSIRPDFTIAYFCRANIRYKLVDYQKNTIVDNNLNTENQTDKTKRLSTEKQTKFDVEMIMRDYDKVIELQPDFAFAYYNKANILCSQKDFRSAISNFTKAIECDADFAEAYFNRGLTYLFIGENAKGLADLSKAGELGIYQSYNLLQRFSK